MSEQWTVERHLLGKPPEVVALYHRFIELAQACGSFTYAVSKSAITLKGTRRGFAGASLGNHALTGYLDLPRRVEDPRITRSGPYTKRLWVHHFRVDSPSQLDQQFAGWLGEAYRVGGGAHLAPRPRPGPDLAAAALRNPALKRPAAGTALGRAPVGLAGDKALHCPVGAVLVAVLAEDAGLVPQVRQGGGGRLLGQPAFLGLVEPLDLALGLGVFGWPFFWVIPRAARKYSKAFRPPPEWGNVSTTTVPVTGAQALPASR